MRESLKTHCMCMEEQTFKCYKLFTYCSKHYAESRSISTRLDSSRTSFPLKN